MSFDPARLQTLLLNTGLQIKDQPLYQVLKDLIKIVASLNTQTSSLISGSGSSSVININQQLIGNLIEDIIDGSDNIIIPGNIGPIGIQGLRGIDGEAGLDGDDSSFRPNPRLQDLISSFTSGSVIFAGPSGFLAQNNANLFWDDTNSIFRATKIQAGAATTFPGIAGDIQANRGGVSPGTGFIYFGNATGAGANYIGFDGTDIFYSGQVKFDFGFIVSASTTSVLAGKTQFGPAFTFPGVNGDIAISRAIAPTTGVIYFGNSAAAHYIYFDATNFNFTDPLALAKKISQYNGINTAGWGVPAIQAEAGGIGLVAANASLASYTVGAADATIRISANVNVTSSVTHSFSIICTYTDETNTVRSLTLPFVQLGGVALVGTITNILGAGPYHGVGLTLRVKASTTITISSTGTFTSVTYNARGVIEQLG